MDLRIYQEDAVYSKQYHCMNLEYVCEVLDV